MDTFYIQKTVKDAHLKPNYSANKITYSNIRYTNFHDVINQLLMCLKLLNC